MPHRTLCRIRLASQVAFFLLFVFLLVLILLYVYKARLLEGVTE
jgi:hypothetical protein